MDDSSDSEDACFAFFADRSDFAFTTGGAFGSANSEALTTLGVSARISIVWDTNSFLVKAKRTLAFLGTARSKGVTAAFTPPFQVASTTAPIGSDTKIGRASCRERV